MKIASVESALRWMLAAWMLLATSVTSSTFVHDHSGGNLSHQHDNFDCTFSHLSVAPTAFHDGHDGDVGLSAVDVHRHGCLALLGAITHQPMPDETSGSHEKSPNGWETIVVSSAQSVRALSKGLAVDHSGLATLVIVAPDRICESKHRETLCAGVAPAAPLCDRARHERSGVQLA